MMIMMKEYTRTFLENHQNIRNENPFAWNRCDLCTFRWESFLHSPFGRQWQLDLAAFVATSPNCHQCEQSSLISDFYHLGWSTYCYDHHFESRNDGIQGLQRCFLRETSHDRWRCTFCRASAISGWNKQVIHKHRESGVGWTRLTPKPFENPDTHLLELGEFVHELSQGLLPKNRGAGGQTSSNNSFVWHATQQRGNAQHALKSTCRC